MRGSWAPRLFVPLAAVAQVGALLPLLLFSNHLFPVGLAYATFSLNLPGVGPSPAALLLVWLGGWLLARTMPRQQGMLTPLLIMGGTLVAWLGLPFWARPTSPLNPIFVFGLLPSMLAAWWSGGRFGRLSFTWASVYDGLRLSGLLCVVGLLCLWPLPRIGLDLALLSPLLLFAAGLALLYLVRRQEEEVSLQTTLAALLPVLAVALTFWLVRSAQTGGLVHLLLRFLLGALSWVGELLLWVASLLAPVAAWLTGLLMRNQVPEPHEEARELGDDGLVPTRDFRLTEWDVPITPVVVGALALLALVLLFWLIRRAGLRRAAGTELDPDERRTGPGLLRGLLSELKAWRDRRPTEVGVEALPPDHPRQLLRRLQAWGARQGRPRAQSETPAQYVQALRPYLREAMELGPILLAYSESRYGSGQPDQGQVESARTLLLELER